MPAEEENADRDEFGPIVQEEVRRLPEKYRAAVVLCYWEGLTQEQAAAQLGCPLGTVRSRLARARDLLRRRLDPARDRLDGRRAGVRSGSLPLLTPELVQSTVHAALDFAAGQTTNPVVSAAAASLVHRMLWRTTMIKLSGMVAGVILVGMAGYGVGSAAQRGEKPQATRARLARAASRPRIRQEPAARNRSRPRPNERPTQFKGGARGIASQSVYANVERETSIIDISSRTGRR